MSVARYSYINAKIRARKAELLKHEQWDALLGSRDMLAALRILDATVYSTLVKDFDAQTSAQTIERALQEDFNQALFEITNDTPESVQHLMLWINRKFQKEVIKTLLRLYTLKADRETAERLFIPVSPFTHEKLLALFESSDLRVLTSNLPDPFFRKLLEDNLPSYEESQELMFLEQVIDAEVFKALYTQSQKLGGQDLQVTINLVGTEIDLINLMTTLRSKFLGLPQERAESFLLTVEYHLPLTLCTTAIHRATLEESIQALYESQYKEVVKAAWEAYEQYTTLRVFEQVFHTHIQTASQEAMLGYPFHFGIILGYLNLKWYETINLKALFHGKAEHLDPPLIRRTLIL